MSNAAGNVMIVRLVLFSLAIGLFAPCHGLAQSPPLIGPTRVLPPPPSPFLGEDGKTAHDLSGIACMPPQGESRRCLVINDENRFAQFAVLDSSGLNPGAPLELIKEHGEDIPVGKMPSGLHCSKGDGGFSDLDGEAVAYAKPYFYVIGSHGCSRKKRKFHASSFITARILVNDKGEPVGADAAKTTYRFADALKMAPDVTAFFGQDLNEARGVNIEGLVVTGGRLFAGLRAPSINNRAYIISTPVDDLFNPGNDPLTTTPSAWPVDLGENRGIRDPALLEDGRVLILAGPSQNQDDVPYELFIAPSLGGKATPLAIIEEVVADGEKGKAEALLPLSVIGNKLRILVLFDSLPNGGAREYEVTMN